MYSPRQQLDTPSDYEFPHAPYGIQQQLMESLYEVIERKRIGIFESPTGTGKSLTLTCAALRWLLDHEALVRRDLQHRIDELGNEVRRLDEDGAKANDWLSAQYESSQRREELGELRRMHVLLEEYENRLQELRHRKKLVPEEKGTFRRVEKEKAEEDHLGNNLLNELKLDDLEDVREKDEEDGAGSEDETYRDVKIYFCSRTHSQLAQVVREVKSTSYAQHIRCVSLASRQQLCIHPQVRRLPNVALMNERCLDMARSEGSQSKVTSCDADGCAQKKSRVRTTPSSAKCTFKTQERVRDLGEASLVKILDIEDLVQAGERTNACPYYAARAANRSAQLVMLPYQMLLHRKTRMQSGIDLRNSVVIIDEAHNLLDTIAQIHSSEISLQQLSLVQNQITAYKMKYSSRFSTANLLKINQLNFIVKRLVKMLTPKSSEEDAPSQSRMLRTHELMSEGEFFNINVFHILEFCERTRFAQKLQGFALRMNQEPKPSENQKPEEPGSLSMLKKLQQEHVQRQNKRGSKQKDVTDDHKLVLSNEAVSKEGEPKEPKVSNNSPIRPLLAFLEALTEAAEDGRVLITCDPAGDTRRSGYKYVLLNPGGHFEEIVRDARAIVIAGGTMQPTAELTDQLFKSCRERVVERFYDHVVPPEAVLPFVVSKGPTGKRFCFNYAQRNSPEMLSELGMTLQNLCNVVPAGVVCFFPSYDFMDTVSSYLEKTGYLERLAQKKRLFREPRSTSSGGQTVEQMLAAYAACIKRQELQGALLFSVVGGKLSEGLNFADDLGRCVVVVGMPYPNRKSPELQERMQYLDRSLGPGAGSEYYENLCMKAVNQCIGRSVRHIKDYACVMLLDERYSSDRVQRKLPQWIARSLRSPAAFGMVQGATAKFFRQKTPL